MKIELYSAPWCSNCATLKKIFNEINVEYDIIDVDEQPELAQLNRIRSLPTTIITTENIRLVEVGCKNKVFWLDLFKELIKE